MAQRTTLAARTTGALTGASVNYAADLDMDLTENGEVTVECTGTLGNATTLVLAFHTGPAANPVGVMTNGIALLSESDAGAGPWVRVVTVRTNQQYFRASVECTGAGDGTGSDAVINYHYSPREATHIVTSLQGAPVINHA